MSNPWEVLEALARAWLDGELEQDQSLVAEDLGERAFKALSKPTQRRLLEEFGVRLTERSDGSLAVVKLG